MGKLHLLKNKQKSNLWQNDITVWHPSVLSGNWGDHLQFTKRDVVPFLSDFSSLPMQDSNHLLNLIHVLQGTLYCISHINTHSRDTNAPPYHQGSGLLDWGSLKSQMVALLCNSIHAASMISKRNLKFWSLWLQDSFHPCLSTIMLVYLKIINIYYWYLVSSKFSSHIVN